MVFVSFGATAHHMVRPIIAITVINKYKYYLISVAEIWITAILYLIEWYFKNSLLGFMQFTEKISWQTTIKKAILKL